jgi:antitoxin component of MazEF toxin-antitoxin module
MNMKFALYHDRKKQFLSLPNAALKLAELHEEAKLTADVEPGSIVLLRDEMTAQEMADTINHLYEMASNLTVKLALAAGFYADDEPTEVPEECRCCEYGCAGVEIPACVLRDAGIDPDDGVSFEVEDGVIVVTATEEDNNQPEELSPVLGATLAMSGVDMEALRELLESGEVIHD